MATLKLVGFSGEIPKLLPRLLPDMSAQAAFNVRLDDGALTPIRKPRRVFRFEDAANYRTIYRHGNEWLGWTGLVNAAPGPVAQDRLYYTGDGVPKMRVGGNVYPLAVPRPTTKLTATVSGTGSGDKVTRLYVYTFVTEFGEESEPCPISDEVEWEPGQTVTLSGFEEPPAGRGITLQRIYRSQTGSGGTDLYFIAERPASNTDFVDNIPPDAINEPLPSRLWNPPPDNLQGLTALPNGMMAGFVGKDLYFCEPYRPHAWPEAYVLTCDYEIVGLGAFGASLVVVTKGHPYVVTGTSPDSMVMEKLELNLPCINPQSVIDLGYAVAYASHEGLVVVSSNGAQLVTAGLISRSEWLRYSPATFVCGQYQGRYYASYRYSDHDLVERTGTLIFDLSGEMPFLVRNAVSAKAFHYSLEDGSLYYLIDNDIYEFDARGEASELMRWRSKQFILPRPTNFGAILIEAEDLLTEEERAALEEEAEKIRQENAQKIAAGRVGGALGAAAFNVHAINGDDLKSPPTFQNTAAVGVYADGRLVAVVNKVNVMRRLPSGFLARQWEVEVSGNMRIAQITLATTGAELMQV